MGRIGRMRAIPALALALLVLTGAVWPGTARAAMPPAEVLQTWYRLILELVRHTPTYSPPVASRSFAYVGVTAYEAVAGGRSDMQSLAGQLNGLAPPPARLPGQAYDEGVVLDAALDAAANAFFANTGPSGQHAMASLGAKLRARAAEGVAPEVAGRSAAYGRAVAAHVLAWSQDDGGAVVENMGFPYDYALTAGPAHWVPTSVIVQQQRPLLPGWGLNRPFAMPAGTTCGLPPPLAYSEDPGSAFYSEALEVAAIRRTLTPEQKAIARFWSDDPMLSSTPPGHWVSIALQVLAARDAAADEQADVLARVGVAIADAFIGCWATKYEYDLLRPVTYIRRLIDPKWEPMLTTPPFPEYPSGHSVQSGAAATVLAARFGDDFAFEDAAHADDGLPPRRFPGFQAAAEEAALSRLYGGIHFRTSVLRGLDQGRCIGAYAAALRTRLP